MTAQFLIFLGLLAALLVLLWRQRKARLSQQRATSPPPPPAKPSHGVAPRRLASPQLYEEAPKPRSEFTADFFRRGVAYFSKQSDIWKALQLSQAFERKYPTDFNDDDRFRQALLFTRLRQLLQAVAVYTALLEQPVPYPLAYNNRGYTYLLLEEYALSIPDFDQAIALDVSTAFAYNNRGLARLRLGHLTEARADIEHSLLLDPANSYAHRNMGIWHFEQQEFALALPYFKEAARLLWNTPDLEDYLLQTCEQLGIAMPLQPFSNN
jgi:tetratricopeptide (TPR) repeat protein